MKECKIQRISPQAAAAAFIEAYTKNSEQIFKELKNELERLPELGNTNFQHVNKDIWVPCQLDVNMLGRNEDGAGGRAIENAIKVWVSVALAAGEESQITPAVINVELCSSARQLRVNVELQLF